MVAPGGPRVLVVMVVRVRRVVLGLRRVAMVAPAVMLVLLVVRARPG
jgi:hypothetical protein